MRFFEAERVSEAERYEPRDVKFVFHSDGARILVEEGGEEALANLLRYRKVILLDRRGAEAPRKVVETALSRLISRYLGSSYTVTVTVAETAGGIPTYTRALMVEPGPVVPTDTTTVTRVYPTEYELEDGTTGEPTFYASGTVRVTHSPTGYAYSGQFELFMDEDEAVAGIVISGNAQLNWAAKPVLRTTSGVSIESIQDDQLGSILALGYVPIAVAAEVEGLWTPHQGLPLPRPTP